MRANRLLLFPLLACAVAFSQTPADPLVPTHDTKSAVEIDHKWQVSVSKYDAKIDFHQTDNALEAQLPASRPGDDLLLVKVAPLIAGEWHGSQPQSFDTVLLATRHMGTSLFPIIKWPVAVQVVRPLIEEVEQRDKLLAGEFENIAWAEVYKSEDDARQKTLRKN